MFYPSGVVCRLTLLCALAVTAAHRSADAAPAALFSSDATDRAALAPGANLYQDLTAFSAGENLARIGPAPAPTGIGNASDPVTAGFETTTSLDAAAPRFDLTPSHPGPDTDFIDLDLPAAGPGERPLLLADHPAPSRFLFHPRTHEDSHIFLGVLTDSPLLPITWPIDLERASDQEDDDAYGALITRAAGLDGRNIRRTAIAWIALTVLAGLWLRRMKTRRRSRRARIWKNEPVAGMLTRTISVQVPRDLSPPPARPR